MQKISEQSVRFSFFSPLCLILALLMGFTAAVSTYFIEHLTVAGIGPGILLPALLRSAAAYLLLILLDLLLTLGGSRLLREKTGENEAAAPSMGRTFLTFFLLSLLIFLPAFLALFPGYTAYDTPMQMEQFFTRGVLNATQPIPLTLLFAGCLQLGVSLFHSANAGLLLHTLIQLLFTSACFALTGCFFVRWGLRRRIAFLLIILPELLPFVQIFALTTAKDGFFSPLFALWLTLTADLFLFFKRNTSRIAPLLGYGSLSLFLILIRPQGKYIFLAAALLLFILQFVGLQRDKKKVRPEELPGADSPCTEGTERSHSGYTGSLHSGFTGGMSFGSLERESLPGSRGAGSPKAPGTAETANSEDSTGKEASRPGAPAGLLRFAGLAAGVLLLSALITGPLYRAAGVYPASPGEMLSLPIQQMTRAVALHQSELSADELAEYDRWLDSSMIETNYIPQISDLMKMSPVFDKAAYSEDKAGFFALWLSLFRKYPLDYADAFLYLTEGYFYPGLGYSHAWAGLADEFIPGPAAYATHAVPLLPALRSFLLGTVGKTFAIDVPVIRRLTVISLAFWFLAFLGSLSLKRRKGAASFILFLLLLYFGTLLLGPVCTVRYVIPLLCAVPVLTALLAACPGKI